MGDGTETRAVRACLVLGQLATLATTWPLWQSARPTPLVPVVDALATISFGPVLVLSALLVLTGTRAAWLGHVLALAVAVLGDAQRLQPAPISIAMMLGACAGLRGLDRRVWHAHLAAVWLAAGAGKLLSGGAFEREVAPLFASAAGGGLAPLVPWLEVGLGVGVLATGTRRAATLLGALLHAAILASLIEVDHNRGVWAWNATLALAALVAWRGARLRRVPRTPSPLAFAVLAWPLTFPLGVLPPSSAFFVYSGLEPVTLVCDREEHCTLDREVHETLRELAVPVPASVALLRASFEARCAPGERWLARERSGDEAVLAMATCTRESAR